MRLLVALLDADKAYAVERELDNGDVLWDVWYVADGEAALKVLSQERFDVMVLHSLLPKADGYAVLDRMWHTGLACPPKVLFLSEPEFCKRDRLRVDCAAPILSTPEQLARLVGLLSKKKRPMLAKAAEKNRIRMIEELLTSLGIRHTLKGRAYIEWMLDQVIPSPILEHEITATLYPSCAAAFRTTAAAVERCVRHAVEEIFTRGSIGGIERYFGTTVDPERGKPTNRAFLVGAAEQLRLRMEAGTTTG